jgi:1-deoxy-D-xylulose-5-phosphate synthase
MDLEAIKNPLFLKNLTDEELRNVCEDIRNYIIDFTSANGGYLSGNLSSVEISVMMNKCFNTEDFLIFDGNDINYTEKILNGRINELQMNSNGAYSLANALGVATARDLEHKDYHVVAVVNSTDLLSGRNIETLNLISSSGRKLIIVFNDDTTIDRGIGMIDRLIASVRKTRSYNNLKDNVKDMIRPSKNGDKIIENIHNLKTNMKKTMIDEGVF